MNAKRVIVAGAAGHLGKILVQDILNEGAQVVSICREASGPALLESLKSTDGQHTCLHSDLNDLKQVEETVAKGVGLLEGLDALVLAQGAFTFQTFEDTTEDAFETLMNANLKSSWLLARSVLPFMRKADFGRIVFVSSSNTQGRGQAGMGLYLASKSALNSMMMCLARELRQTKITVNGVLPSIIDSEANRKAMPNQDFTNWVAPEALVTLIKNIIDDDTTKLTGALIPVYGGL